MFSITFRVETFLESEGRINQDVLLSIRHKLHCRRLKLSINVPCEVNFERIRLIMSREVVDPVNQFDTSFQVFLSLLSLVTLLVFSFRNNYYLRYITVHFLKVKSLHHYLLRGFLNLENNQKLQTVKSKCSRYEHERTATNAVKVYRLRQKNRQ